MSEELKATIRQTKELKWALTLVWAKEVELSQTIEAARTEISLLDEETQFASTLMLSLEKEQRRKAISSEKEVRAKAPLCHDVVEKMKGLEDQIWQIGDL